MLSIQLIKDLINSGNTNITPGLERVQEVLALLGNPQDKYKVIHITGTNGKGSTATFLETGLVHAGYCVGKFTSPYISLINECICLNQQPISDSELENTYQIIKQLLIKHNLKLSPFEFLTVIMFKYFARQQIDWLVLEVGMGGLYDSTNVVNSAYSIITNIALEHTQWLGSTLDSIAKHKAGIIKNGKTILGSNLPQLIEEVAGKTTNFINVIDYYQPQITLDSNTFKTQLCFSDRVAETKQDSNLLNPVLVEYDLSLWGKFQAYNFLCAYAVFTDIGLSKSSITYAAQNTKWPGRLEVISIDPLVILDATHNTHGAEILCSTLDGLYAKDEVVIITSILKDKDIKAMLNFFSRLTDHIIYTTIDNNPRGMNACDLEVFGKGMFKYTNIFDNPKEALKYAQNLNKKMILITGSLYLLSYIDIKE